MLYSDEIKRGKNMTSPFDALFNIGPPAAAAPSPRQKITENGRCLSCGTEVFWTGYGNEPGVYVEASGAGVKRHQCNRTTLNDFDAL